MKSAIAAAFVLVAGCAGAPKLPAETQGTFIIERDLMGETVARGEFSAINGTQRAFTAYLTGTLEGDTFTLNERFEYDDGERDEKTWVLTIVEDGRYTGTREDVVGEAVGYQDGPAFRLEYDIRLPNDEGEPGMQVRFRDVMVKTETGSVLNRARVSKWGFNVGRVELEITPGSADVAASQ